MTTLDPLRLFGTIEDRFYRVLIGYSPNYRFAHVITPIPALRSAVGPTIHNLRAPTRARGDLLRCGCPWS